MDKNNLYTLIPYILLIIIATVFVTTKINSCNEPVYTTLQRDTTYQKSIDSIQILVQRIKRLEEIQDSALMINQSGIIANEKYFIRVMNEFVKAQKIKKSLPLNEQWNNYLKELESE